MKARLLLAALLAASLGGIHPAHAQSGVQIEDRVDVLLVDRRLIAVNATGQSVAELVLELGEEVVASGSQGRLGVAATTARLLGIRAGDPGWTELRYRVSERKSPPERLHLEDRIALVTLPMRIVALTSSSRGWLELGLSPGERVEGVLSDTNLAAVVTPRRAIAISDGSGFVEIGLGPREQIESTSARSSSISLVTERRVLVFRAGSAFWVEVPRKDKP